MQGLENGGFASTTSNGVPVTNPGAAPPTVDREYEAGVKTQIGKALLTGAFFDVSKASNVLLLNPTGTSYTYETGGLQVQQSQARSRPDREGLPRLDFLCEA